MAGLLDFISSPGAMDLAQGLLAAGRPSAVPVSTGQALGQGLQAYRAGQQARMAQKRALEKDELNKRLTEAKIKEMAYNSSPSGNIGKITPGDYTPDSIAKFSVTKDYNDLERYNAPGNDRLTAEWIFKNKDNKPLMDAYAFGKRSLQTVDTGPELVTIDPVDPTQNLAERKKGISPELEPEFKADQTEATTRAAIETKSTVEAEQQLPQYMADAEEQIRLIDEMLAHPGLGYAVGKSSRLPLVKGYAPYDFNVRLEQLKGKQFMEAYKTLKGGGQITEVEGKKATEALARMDRATSEPEFKKASREYQRIVVRGLERAKMKAKYGVNKRTQPGTPEPPMMRGGELSNGAKNVLKKYGYE